MEIKKAAKQGNKQVIQASPKYTTRSTFKHNRWYLYMVASFHMGKKRSFDNGDSCVLSAKLVCFASEPSSSLPSESSVLFDIMFA